MGFDVVERIVSVLEAPKPLVFLSYCSSVAKVRGPNITSVESLLKGRGNLDRPVLDSERNNNTGSLLKA